MELGADGGVEKGSRSWAKPCNARPKASPTDPKGHAFGRLGGPRSPWQKLPRHFPRLFLRSHLSPPEPPPLQVVSVARTGGRRQGADPGLCALRQWGFSHLRSGLRECVHPAERSWPHPLPCGHPSGSGSPSTFTIKGVIGLQRNRWWISRESRRSPRTVPACISPPSNRSDNALGF